MNLSTKQKQTHRQGEQTCDCQGGRRGGVEWEVGVGRCKLLYVEGINKSYCTVQRTIFNIL